MQNELLACLFAECNKFLSILIILIRLITLFTVFYTLYLGTIYLNIV